MRPVNGRVICFVLALGIAFCGAMSVGGCRKSKTPPPLPVIALGGNDLNPNGTITDKGLKQIESQAGEKELCVGIIRSNLSDAGLMQLARFKNIRRIEAVGSTLTADGIQKFKQESPEVEVVK